MRWHWTCPVRNAASTAVPNNLIPRGLCSAPCVLQGGSCVCDGSSYSWDQGRALGAATFQRLEGCWYGNDRKVYIVSTNGGRGQGQIWVYDPAAETISLLFQSPGKDVLNKPDHITVSPRGGLVLCEDGGGVQFVRGLTPSGEIFDFAVNQLNDAEFAGACFSPDGGTLFVNIQGDTTGSATDPGVRGGGMTLAIWGPWEKGAL